MSELARQIIEGQQAANRIEPGSIVGPFVQCTGTAFRTGEQCKRRARGGEKTCSQHATQWMDEKLARMDRALDEDHHGEPHGPLLITTRGYVLLGIFGGGALLLLVWVTIWLALAVHSIWA